MRTIRILHLVRSLNVGGLERVVCDLASGLHSRGVANYLGCLLEEGEWAESAPFEGCWVGHRDRRGRLTVLRELVHFVKENRIDVIHTHNSHPHKYGVPASVLSRAPLVHTKHGRNWPDNPRWVWFSRQLSRFTACVVPVSREIASIVTDVERVPGNRVRTILNGVDPARFCEGATDVRRELGVPEDALVVGSVGRLSAEKQYVWLVEVFAEIARQEPSARLLIVGDGPERAGIEAAIRSSAVQDKVVLTGMRQDSEACLRAMDVFCLSSDQEGTSVTLIEAGMCGLPAVVTDVGGNPEIVEDGVTGRVVPSGDTGAFVHALLDLMGSRAQRVAMGKAARERTTARYGLQRMIDEYLDVYSRVTRARGRGSSQISESDPGWEGPRPRGPKPPQSDA